MKQSSKRNLEVLSPLEIRFFRWAGGRGRLAHQPPNNNWSEKTLPTGPKNNWCQENNLPACHRPQKLWGNSVQGLDTQTKKSQNFILSTLGKIISWKIQSPHSGNQLWKIQSIQTQGILSRNIQTHWKCFLEIFNLSTTTKKKQKFSISPHQNMIGKRNQCPHTRTPPKTGEKVLHPTTISNFSTLPTNFCAPSSRPP